MYGYIYETTNLINGKKYIGKHKSSKFDKNYYGSGINFSKALNKYGKENFKVIILEEINTNQEDLDLKEMYYIEKYNAVKSKNYYNISSGGKEESWCGFNLSVKRNLVFSGMKGKHHTEKTKEKISMSKKEKLSDSNEIKKYKEAAKTRWSNLNERIKQSERFKGKNNPMYGKSSYMKGKTLSLESRLKISEKAKERFKDIHEREKVSVRFKNKHISDEHKNKISNSLKGKFTGKENSVSKKCILEHNNVSIEFDCVKDLINYLIEEYNLKLSGKSIFNLLNTELPYNPRCKKHTKAKGIIIKRVKDF